MLRLVPTQDEKKQPGAEATALLHHLDVPLPDRLQHLAPLEDVRTRSNVLLSPKRGLRNEFVWCLAHELLEREPDSGRAALLFDSAQDLLQDEMIDIPALFGSRQRLYRAASIEVESERQYLLCQLMPLLQAMTLRSYPEAMEHLGEGDLQKLPRLLIRALSSDSPEALSEARSELQVLTELANL